MVKITTVTPNNVRYATASKVSYPFDAQWCHMGTAIKHPVPNDGLTRPGTGCFIAVPMWHHWASKG